MLDWDWSARELLDGISVGAGCLRFARGPVDPDIHVNFVAGNRQAAAAWSTEAGVLREEASAQHRDSRGAGALLPQWRCHHSGYPRAP